jgi:hypothetical protein
MTRNELEGFCLYQNSTSSEQDATIRDNEVELDAAETADGYRTALFDELRTAVIRKDCKPLEAQRTIYASRKVITACRDSVKNLGLMLAGKDQLIACLSPRLAEVSVQVVQSSHRLPSALPPARGRIHERSSPMPFSQIPRPRPPDPQQLVVTRQVSLPQQASAETGCTVHLLKPPGGGKEQAAASSNEADASRFSRPPEG